jgi:dTDP-4-dehydrorhamnose 3,5-epimerase
LAPLGERGAAALDHHGTVLTDLDVQPTAIDGLMVLAVKTISDDRGAVRELFRQSAWAGHHSLPDVGPWLQVNVTESVHGSVRGLHGETMNKLVTVVSGEAFGAYVDARRDSSSFGQVVTIPLSLGRAVVVPGGVCNGFQTTTEQSIYVYCFDREWEPVMPGVAVNALDPALAIAWPLPVDPSDRRQLSEKDGLLPTFAEAVGAG